MHGLLPLMLFLAAASPDGGGGEAPLPVVRHASQGGVGITVTVDRVGGAKASGPLREREDVAVRIELKDETTGAPVRGARPAVWLDSGRTMATSCRDRIDTYLGGKFLGRPDVDLNTFRVVAMNDDATLTVVDPLFGFGGTRLLAMVELTGPADDWALNGEGTSIFVTAPAGKQLARVETAGWTIAKSVTLPSPPHRLVLQPDEGYVWTATDEALVALRPADLSVAASIPLGGGRHDLVVSRDSKTVVATSYEAGTVTVVDVARLAVIRKVEIAAPVSVAWSGSSATAYVASERGSIYAVDRGGIVATMKAAPGLKLVRTAPGERFVLAINPTEKSIDVIDVVANEIVQSGELPGIPDDVGFSDSVAYITLRDSEQVQMIVIATLGQKGAPPSVAEVPGGQRAFGGQAGALAPRVTQVAGESAVLFANGPDKVIYYYREGMAAPMGNFANYDRQPRAVMVVDRSLRERKPGSYETSARLAGAGTYAVALLVDSPRVVQCFALDVAPDPSRPVVRRPSVALSLVPPASPAKAGERISLRFRLTTPDGAAPPPLGDALVLLFAPGVWQGRELPRAAGNGTYAVDFIPPAAGSYFAYVLAPAVGLDYALAGQIEVGEAAAPREAHGAQR